MRHLPTIAIVVVWLGLMGALVRRESTPVPGCSLRDHWTVTCHGIFGAVASRHQG
jgi:hypothetical protein